MSRLFFIPQAVRIDSTGTPYGAAEANFYLTTTTTRTNTYEENSRSTPHANPVIADSAGQFPAIYLDPAITYRCVITQASGGAQISDTDPVHAPITASDITIVDSGTHFAGTDVEAVTQDIGANYGKKSATNTWTQVQTHAAAVAMADNVIGRAEMKDYSLTHSVITSSSNAITADCSAGNSFYHLLTENTTFTLSNPSPTGKLCQIIIRIKQDGAGGQYTVAWPGTVTWASGSNPVISTGNDAIDKFTLTTDDAGTLWFGEFGQSYGSA